MRIFKVRRKKGRGSTGFLFAALGENGAYSMLGFGDSPRRAGGAENGGKLFGILGGKPFAGKPNPHQAARGLPQKKTTDCRERGGEVGFTWGKCHEPMIPRQKRRVAFLLYISWFFVFFPGVLNEKNSEFPLFLDF